MKIRCSVVCTSLFLVGISIDLPQQLKPSDSSTKEVKVEDVCASLIKAINTEEYGVFRSLASKTFGSVFDDPTFRRVCREIVDEYGKLIRLSKVLGTSGGLYKLHLHAEKQDAILWLALDTTGNIAYYRFGWVRAKLVVPTSNSIALRVPFVDDWRLEDGMTRETNHHDPADWFEAERYAIDFRRAPAKGSSLRLHQDLPSFPGYGEPILAAADGEVVLVVDGIPDNVPGEPDLLDELGNYIVIKHSETEFSLYAHLAPYRTSVRVGQPVVSGQFIGRCGNSGLSLFPHLHFQMQNSADLTIAKGFPFTFHDATVVDGNKQKRMKDYSPRRGDVVRGARH